MSQLLKWNKKRTQLEARPFEIGSFLKNEPIFIDDQFKSIIVDTTEDIQEFGIANISESNSFKKIVNTVRNRQSFIKRKLN